MRGRGLAVASALLVLATLGLSAVTEGVTDEPFLDTMKDPEFPAEATRSKLDIDPVTGEEIEKIVASLFSLDASLVARLKDILLQ